MGAVDRSDAEAAEWQNLGQAVRIGHRSSRALGAVCHISPQADFQNVSPVEDH